MVVGAIGQAVRGERGFMTKQLNVVDHKIKLFKAPLPPPRYPKGYAERYALALPSGRAKRYPLGRRKTLAQLRVLGKPSSVFWTRECAPTDKERRRRNLGSSADESSSNY